MEDKKWYEAKTVWFNLVMLVGSILGAAGIISTTELDPATVGIILTVINFLLRLITKKAIVWKS